MYGIPIVFLRFKVNEVYVEDHLERLEVQIKSILPQSGTIQTIGVEINEMNLLPN